MKIAIIVQRFGREILGGAERHAALVASLLARHHEVEVLTSAAADYRTWAPVLPPGPAREDGLVVRRFVVERGREPFWPALHDLLLDGVAAEDFAGLAPADREAFERRVRAWPEALQEAYLRAQGPHCPTLHDHLRTTRYDRHLFFTYLYPTTLDGLDAIAPARARVVPTFHDEPTALLPIVGRRLARTRLLCSTQAEVALLSRLHPAPQFDARVLGYGVALPEDRPAADPCDSPYLLFAGRIDPQKGIAELLHWYAALRSVAVPAPRLVLAGEVLMDLPRMPGLETPGVVSEERKLELMRGALALVHASPFESLGIVLLEAAACRTPLIVNATCAAMVEICQEGHCGIPVRDAAEAVAAVQALAADVALRNKLGAAGRAFVTDRFSLAAYEQRLLEEFPRRDGASSVVSAGNRRSDPFF